MTERAKKGKFFKQGNRAIALSMAKGRKQNKAKLIIALSIVIVLLLVLIVFLLIYFNTGVTSSGGSVIVNLG